MPNGVTTTGIQTATQAEIFSNYQAALQAIYGSSINIESDTPDGQWINIFIQSVLDVEDLIVQTFNTFNPDTAFGTILDQRVAINGIQRQAGTYTVTNITIVTSPSVNLYGLDQSVQPVFTVADASGNQWLLIATQLAASGTIVAAFRAATPGAVLTIPNTITVPVTIVLGITSVNNPTVYTSLGIDEESDVALRIRRQKSVSLPAQGFFQGLLAALENIPGISSAFVNENTTSGVDANGIPGHSIWVVVSGTPTNPLAVAYSSATTYAYGAIVSSAGVNYISIANNNLNHAVSNASYWEIYNPIPWTIYNYRNAGCGMKGSQSYAVAQIDGSFLSILWDYVVAQNLFIKVTVNSLNGVNVPNISAIQSYLVSNYLPGVNAEVNVNQVSSLVGLADSNTMATYPSGFGFSLTSGGSYTLALKPTALNNQFAVSATNIILLPMVLSCPGATYSFNLVSGAYQVANSNASVTNGGNTLAFSTVGGYGAMTYAVISGTGSINALTGVYTSSTAGSDTVRVTDALSNTMTCIVTVL